MCYPPPPPFSFEIVNYVECWTMYNECTSTQVLLHILMMIKFCNPKDTASVLDLLWRLLSKTYVPVVKNDVLRNIKSQYSRTETYIRREKANYVLDLVNMFPFIELKMHEAPGLSFFLSLPLCNGVSKTINPACSIVQCKNVCIIHFGPKIPLKNCVKTARVSTCVSKPACRMSEVWGRELWMIELYSILCI